MFRRDQKNEDSFQRQIAALREQLGSSADDADVDELTIGQEPTPIWSAPSSQDMYPSPSFGTIDAGAYGYPPEPAASQFDLAIANPSLPAMPDAELNATVVAPNAKWNGELSTVDPIHVHGQFQGAINSGSEVFIGQDANVEATVHAHSIVIAGLIKGKMEASTRLEILPTGRVTGDVHAPSLVVHQGAILSGSVKMLSSTPNETPATFDRKAAKSGV